MQDVSFGLLTIYTAESEKDVTRVSAEICAVCRARPSSNGLKAGLRARAAEIGGRIGRRVRLFPLSAPLGPKTSDAVIRRLRILDRFSGRNPGIVPTICGNRRNLRTGPAEIDLDPASINPVRRLTARPEGRTPSSEE